MTHLMNLSQPVSDSQQCCGQEAGCAGGEQCQGQDQGMAQG